MGTEKSDLPHGKGCPFADHHNYHARLDKNIQHGSSLID